MNWWRFKEAKDAFNSQTFLEGLKSKITHLNLKEIEIRSIVDCRSTQEDELPLAWYGVQVFAGERCLWEKCVSAMGDGCLWSEKSNQMRIQAFNEAVELAKHYQSQLTEAIAQKKIPELTIRLTEEIKLFQSDFKFHQDSITYKDEIAKVQRKVKRWVDSVKQEYPDQRLTYGFWFDPKKATQGHLVKVDTRWVSENIERIISADTLIFPFSYLEKIRVFCMNREEEIVVNEHVLWINPIH